MANNIFAGLPVYFVDPVTKLGMPVRVVDAADSQGIPVYVVDPLTRLGQPIYETTEQVARWVYLVDENTGQPLPPAGGTWILVTGFWDDAGVWDDTAAWID